jgi:hypothetical protein
MPISLKIKELLFHPDTFFVQAAEFQGILRGLVLPAVIVLMSGISILLGAVLFAACKQPPSSEYSIIDSIARTLQLSGFFSFIFPIIIWILATLIMYAASRKLSGSGTVMATFQNTGYAMLPTSIHGFASNLLTVLMMIVLPQDGSVPSFLAFAPVVILSSLGPVFILWSGYLWVCSIIHTHRISVGNAIIAVGAAAIVIGLVYLAGLAFG